MSPTDKEYEKILKALGESYAREIGSYKDSSDFTLGRDYEGKDDWGKFHGLTGWQGMQAQAEDLIHNFYDAKPREWRKLRNMDDVSIAAEIGLDLAFPEITDEYMLGHAITMLRRSRPELFQWTEDISTLGYESPDWRNSDESYAREGEDWGGYDGKSGYVGLKAYAEDLIESDPDLWNEIKDSDDVTIVDELGLGDMRETNREQQIEAIRQLRQEKPHLFESYAREKEDWGGYNGLTGYAGIKAYAEDLIESDPDTWNEIKHKRNDDDIAYALGLGDMGETTWGQQAEAIRQLRQEKPYLFESEGKGFDEFGDVDKDDIDRNFEKANPFPETKAPRLGAEGWDDIISLEELMKLRDEEEKGVKGKKYNESFNQDAMSNINLGYVDDDDHYGIVNINADTTGINEQTHPQMGDNVIAPEDTEEIRKGYIPNPNAGLDDFKLDRDSKLTKGYGAIRDKKE